MNSDSLSDIFLNHWGKLNLSDQIIFVSKYFQENWFDIENDFGLKCNVSRAFSMTVHRLRKKYSIYNYPELIEKQISILNNNQILDISPLIIEKKLWEQIIIYELSLLQKKERTFKIDQYLQIIEDISLKIDGIYHYKKFPERQLLEDPYTSFSQNESGNTEIYFYEDTISGKGFSISKDEFLISSNDFSVPLKSFEDFLIQLKNNLENQYALKTKIIISESGSQNLLIKGLNELFKGMEKRGLKTPNNISKGINDFVYSITNEKNKSFKNNDLSYFSFDFLKGRNLNKFRKDFAKFFIFLSFSNYFTSNKETVVKVLSEYLNREQDLGFSESTLDRISLKDCSRFSDETQTMTSNIRYNLLNTVLLNNNQIETQYKNSKAYKASN